MPETILVGPRGKKVRVNLTQALKGIKVPDANGKVRPISDTELAALKAAVGILQNPPTSS